MDWKVFFATFGTIFLAEMGDKTQLACLTMTAKTRLPWVVLLATSAALVLASIIGVVAGTAIGHCIPANLIKKAAGAAFVVIGGVMLLGKW